MREYPHNMKIIMTFRQKIRDFKFINLNAMYKDNDPLFLDVLTYLNIYHFKSTLMIERKFYIKNDQFILLLDDTCHQ